MIVWTVFHRTNGALSNHSRTRQLSQNPQKTKMQNFVDDLLDRKTAKREHGKNRWPAWSSTNLVIEEINQLFPFLVVRRLKTWKFWLLLKNFLGNTAGGEPWRFFSGTLSCTWTVTVNHWVIQVNQGYVIARLAGCDFAGQHDFFQFFRKIFRQNSIEINPNYFRTTWASRIVDFALIPLR